MKPALLGLDGLVQLPALLFHKRGLSVSIVHWSVVRCPYPTKHPVLSLTSGHPSTRVRTMDSWPMDTSMDSLSVRLSMESLSLARLGSRSFRTAPVASRAPSKVASPSARQWPQSGRRAESMEMRTVEGLT